ncbi:MAG: hypothetical protein KJ052_00110 [Candidatus Hydrogenedentes bacterium]|nr:hypothetical protein [Candidatus Hydrogenedentota bacterium]
MTVDKDREGPDNFERLRAHLKDDSLAAVLLEAYRNPGALTPYEAMKVVLNARIEQVRSALADLQA